MKLSNWIAILVISTLTSLVLPATAATAAAAVQPQLAAAAVQAQININQASAELIAEVLSGIGLKRAKAIVRYRTANGPFKSAEDLLQVKGVGAATLQKNRDRISF